MTFQADVEASMAVDINATFQIGVEAAGTLVPPSLASLLVTAGERTLLLLIKEVET